MLLRAVAYCKNDSWCNRSSKVCRTKFCSKLNLFLSPHSSLLTSVGECRLRRCKVGEAHCACTCSCAKACACTCMHVCVCVCACNIERAFNQPVRWFPPQDTEQSKCVSKYYEEAAGRGEQQRTYALQQLRRSHRRRRTTEGVCIATTTEKPQEEENNRGHTQCNHYGEAAGRGEQQRTYAS